MAARAKAPLAAGEGDEHLVAAFAAGASHAGEAEVQVAATEELADHVADDGPSEAVAFFVSLGINVLELREVPFDDPIQGRLARATGAVDGY